MRTLRLLLWEDCPRSCTKCPNKTISEIPPLTEDLANYDEIILTGGEPLMHIAKLIQIICLFRKETTAPIYIYTAGLIDVRDALYMLRMVDGITLSVYNKDDANWAIMFTGAIHAQGLQYKSLRLNVFDGVISPDEWWVEGTWEHKHKQYLDDCPIPEHEDFRRWMK